MAQVQQFLETYRRLEALAPRVLPRDGRDNRGGVIARLCRLPMFAPYREELDCCREVRNLLTHEVMVGGSPAVVPGDGMVAFLERMIELIENPARVSTRMTPRARLYTLTPDMKVKSVMAKMQYKGLSRVPLLDDEDRVTGMFSLESIFSAVARGEQIDENTTLADLAEYLPLAGNNTMSAYRFVSPDMTLAEAETLFLHMSDRRTKLRAILVTDDGTVRGKLVGILSPYDVMNEA